MISKISDVKATARGVVVQSSVATHNGIDLSKKSFLINVTELFDITLIVHFQAMSSKRQCKCGRKEHGLLRSLCNVMTLIDVGSVPFHIIETTYRI